jgi:hypothetical protein
MIWFFAAADRIMSDYDRASDHDGPRHFEKGLSLMVGKLIRNLAEKRGPDSARQLARLVVMEGEEALRLLDRAARSAAEPPISGDGVNT